MGGSFPGTAGWVLKKLPIKMGYHPIILGVKPIFKGMLRAQEDPGGTSSFSSIFLASDAQWPGGQGARGPRNVGTHTHPVPKKYPVLPNSKSPSSLEC